MDVFHGGLRMGWFSVWRKRNDLSRRLKQHVAPATLDRLVVAERKFPVHMRPDVQHACSSNGDAAGSAVFCASMDRLPPCAVGPRDDRMFLARRVKQGRSRVPGAVQQRALSSGYEF